MNGYSFFAPTKVLFGAGKLGELEKHETLTIVIPQLVTKIWQMPLHNQTTLMLESALVGRRNVAMVTIPYLIDS